MRNSFLADDACAALSQEGYAGPGMTKRIACNRLGDTVGIQP